MCLLCLKCIYSFRTVSSSLASSPPELLYHPFLNSSTISTIESEADPVCFEPPVFGTLNPKKYFHELLEGFDLYIIS